MTINYYYKEEKDTMYTTFMIINMYQLAKMQIFLCLYSTMR